jgi:hypothetical protein
VIGGYIDDQILNEELTPDRRRVKKLRVMGDSDAEFTRQSTDEGEESEDPGVVDAKELAAAKAQSGGRGTKQEKSLIPTKSPAKSQIIPPQNEKKAPSTPKKSIKRVAQEKLPPKKAVKQGQVPRNPIAKKGIKASPVLAGGAIAKSKKKNPALDKPCKTKVTVTAGSAPSTISPTQAPPSGKVSRKQPSNKKNTSVRIVTVTPKIVEQHKTQSGDALSGKSLSSVRQVPKDVIERTSLVDLTVSDKLLSSIGPTLDKVNAPILEATKRLKECTTPYLAGPDSELSDYMSAKEDP